MKKAGSNLELVYHVDVEFTNKKKRCLVYYNADNAKDAVRYYENKYGTKCTIYYWVEYV